MKNLRILLLFALGIFLISNASAMVLSGLWQNNANSITITSGNSVSFTVDFGSMNTPVSLSESLYNSSDKLVWQKQHSGLSSGYLTDTISQNLPAGNYQLIINGNDNANHPYSSTLSLTVNSVVPPTNSTPTITPIPNQTANESANYSYQVLASDSDGDRIFYSLPSNVLGFLINSTGFISGITPSVNADTNFTITVQVSDGLNIATQNYNLTVKNISSVNPPVNQTLTVQFVYPTPLNNSHLVQNFIPVNLTFTNSSVISTHVFLYDSAHSLLQNVIATPSQVEFDSLSPGTYYINATISDNLGNSSSTETRTITLLASSNNGTLNYVYNDVYQNQYLQQLNRTNPGITVSPQSSSPFSFDFAFLLIAILLVLIILGLILFVFAKRKFSN